MTPSQVDATDSPNSGAPILNHQRSGTLIADEAVEDTLANNTNFMGHLFYNYSVLHCLPQAMVFPDAVGTGTVIKPSTLRGYANDAGFASVDVLSIENPQFRFYRLNP